MRSVFVEHDKPVALANGRDSVGILGVTDFWQRVPGPHSVRYVSRFKLTCSPRERV